MPNLMMAHTSLQEETPALLTKAAASQLKAILSKLSKSRWKGLSMHVATKENTVWHDCQLSLAYTPLKAADAKTALLMASDDQPKPCGALSGSGYSYWRGEKISFKLIGHFDYLPDQSVKGPILKGVFAKVHDHPEFKNATRRYAFEVHLADRRLVFRNQFVMGEINIA